MPGFTYCNLSYPLLHLTVSLVLTASIVEESTVVNQLWADLCVICVVVVLETCGSSPQQSVCNLCGRSQLSSVWSLTLVSSLPDQKLIGHMEIFVVNKLFSYERQHE